MPGERNLQGRSTYFTGQVVKHYLKYTIELRKLRYLGALIEVTFPFPGNHRWTPYEIIMGVLCC